MKQTEKKIIDESKRIIGDLPPSITITKDELVKMIESIIVAREEAQNDIREREQMRRKWREAKRSRMMHPKITILQRNVHTVGELSELYDFIKQHTNGGLNEARLGSGIAAKEIYVFDLPNVSIKKVVGKNFRVNGVVDLRCDGKTVDIHFPFGRYAEVPVVEDVDGKSYIYAYPDYKTSLLTEMAIGFLYDDQATIKDALLRMMIDIHPQVTADVDVAGYDDIIARCKNILASRVGVNRNILIGGPPGTGKSQIVKRILRESPDWFHVIVTRANADLIDAIPMIDAVMRYIERRIIVVMDEIDEIGEQRRMGGANLSHQLIRIMDGANDIKNVTIIGTTNRPKEMDPALLRVGRLGPMFKVDMPSPEQVATIIHYYNTKYNASVDVDAIALRFATKVTGCDIRGAFENCIIDGVPITTDAVLSNIQSIQSATQFSSEMYV